MVAGTTETEQHGTRTGTEKNKHEKHEKDIEQAFFLENVLSHVWRYRYNVFFSKKYQDIVVFHKHKLTMAGTTETERYGTRTGTEKKTWETRARPRTNIFWENVLSHVWRCRYNIFFSKKYQDIVVFHKHKLMMAGISEPEQHGTRRGTEKKTWETRARPRTNIFWENVLSHVWRCRYNIFFSKKYQDIVVFHKHKLTMAGISEPEQHGTRRGTDKKTWQTRERHRTSIFWENVLSHVWRCRYNVFFSKKY